jgi:hypothetical protein
MLLAKFCGLFSASILRVKAVRQWARCYRPLRNPSLPSSLRHAVHAQQSRRSFSRRHSTPGPQESNRERENRADTEPAGMSHLLGRFKEARTPMIVRSNRARSCRPTE